MRRKLHMMFFLAMSLIALKSYAQCDFKITPNPVCGSTPVLLEVINPDSSKDYSFRFGSVLPKADGDTVTVVFPGDVTDQTYSISLFDGNQLCKTTPPSRKTITVKSAPDATALADITGTTSKPFTLCTGTTANPEFFVKVQNNSATKAVNTKYTIDWGDGSPQATFGSTFDTTSHTYTTQGYFTLVYTVEAPGLSCNKSTVTYSVFNGNIPAGGISSNGSTIGGCAPKGYQFNLENTANNSAGTQYTIYLNEEEVATYSHPAPATIWVNFEDHSCGLKGPNGFPNSHLLELEIKNQCFTFKVPTSPIVLSSPPLANFIYDQDICIGEPITFINTTLGATINSDGTCSVVKDPRWTIEPDTGWVLLNGCLDNGCDTIKVQFNSPGPWDIEAYLENPCGEDSITKTILLEPPPVADANATVDNPLGCEPITVSFTNLSQATNPTYLWTVSPAGGSSFTGGTNKNSVNPKIKFTQPGLYIVSLSIPSGCGDGTWDTTILVKGAPRVTIDPIPDQCDIFTYTPTATIGTSNSPLTAVNWQFPGGSPASFSGLGTPPDVNYTSTGTYTVTASATNICGTGTDSESFTILSSGPPSVGADTAICETSNAFKLKATPSGGVWSGAGVVNDTFFPAIAGIGPHVLTYDLTLGNCTVSNTKLVDVQAKPIADAGDTVEICQNAPPTALTGATPPGGTWSGTGITDPSGIFDPAGLAADTFFVTYIYSGSLQGCADTSTKVVIVNPLPVFAITDTNDLCLNQSIEMADLLDTTVAVSSGSWDFGDGNTSTDPQGQHTYTSPGTYQVTFTGTSTKGCTASSSTWVKVLPPPALSFTKSPDGACFGTFITFTMVTNLNGKFLWDFGTGKTDTSRTPAPVFYKEGQLYDTTYYVTLTGFYQCDTLLLKDSVKIRRSPVANFGTPTNTGCTPFTVPIFNATTGTPDSYNWDFGNGNTSTSPNPPPQTYVNIGIKDTIYTIRLIVENTCGKDTLDRKITVTPKNVKALLSANPLSGCPPLDVTFESFSTPGASVFWDFGDGQTAVGSLINYRYKIPGTYTVILVASTACATDSATTTITVSPKPVMDFTVTPENCVDAPVTFTNTSTGSLSNSWNFGDNFVSTIQSPTHTYQFAGAYTVVLAGKNSAGCPDTIEKDISVYPQPIADFDVLTDPTCAGTPLEFDNLSADADNFIWDFGDGTTATVAYPVKAYTDAGIYDITLVAIKNNYCFDTLIRLSAVDILTSPVADFSYQQVVGIDAGTVNFTNLSADATVYIWDFGDGSPRSSEVNPTHIYEFGGKKTVKLIAITPDGCVDSIEKIIDIKFGGEIYVPNAFAPLSATGTDAGLFKPKGYGLRSYVVEVYSTYGELLWRSDRIENGQPVEGWDGYYKGQLMPQDNYVWKISAVLKDGTSWEGAEDPDGKRHVMGVVMLLR